MLITRLATDNNEAAIETIVAQISNAAYEGNLYPQFGNARSGKSVRFVLRCKSSRGPGARRSSSGRRTVSATWEAHKLVMDMIFAYWPKVTMVTVLATYHGADEFKVKHVATYAHNAGSRMCPVQFGDL